MDINYYSSSRLHNSVNAVCIKALRSNGHNINELYIGDNFKEYRRMIRDMAKNKSADLIFIGYDSPKLVVISRIFTRKKIIYNAALSVYERLIISRELAPRLSVKAVYYWLLDFVAVHFANLTMVETNLQADYFKKIFKVSKKKIYRSWVGVDGDRFFYDSALPKLDIFTVLFRGAFMPEAGVEYAIKAAKILEDKNVKFTIIGGGILLEKTTKLIKELKPANLELITDFLPQERLREIMQSCHLLLGQLSDHDRLSRTIPHKTYESLAMKLPYLTASNSGVLELLTPDKTCLTCNPADAKSLAEKILWTKNNYSIAEEIAENGYKLYQDQLRSHVLAKNLLDRMASV